MRRELTAGDFDSPESMENEGILDVFPVIHPAPVGQKIRCSAETELFRGSLSVGFGQVGDGSDARIAAGALINPGSCT